MGSDINYGPPPVRGARHEQLDVFVGRWYAEGQSFGGPQQDLENPRSNGEQWRSDEVVEWHAGQFFVVGLEDAKIKERATLVTRWILGFDAQTDELFSFSIEDHGFSRRYAVKVEGRMWTFTGATERASVEFSEDGTRQTVRWEWRPRGDRWLPLCDRVNVRVG